MTVKKRRKTTSKAHKRAVRKTTKRRATPKKAIKRTARKITKKRTVAKKTTKRTAKRGTKKTPRKTHKTIKKSKASPQRVSTTIKNFDSLIEGGFEKNSTNLVVGDVGSGKSIFATQFLLGGMEKGEKCLYVTFEEKKEKFYKNMKKFGWDLEEYEKKGLFTFLEYTPIKVKTMLEEGGGAIENTIIKNKISRMVIDSITSFALLFEDELEKREAALTLFNMIGDWNCTSLLTFEGEPFQDEKIASRTLEFESDSIVLFYYLRDKGERHRYLEILKMRGTKHSKKIYRFHIDKEGITVYTKPVSKINIAK